MEGRSQTEKGGGERKEGRHPKKKAGPLTNARVREGTDGIENRNLAREVHREKKRYQVGRGSDLTLTVASPVWKMFQLKELQVCVKTKVRGRTNTKEPASLRGKESLSHNSRKWPRTPSSKRGKTSIGENAGYSKDGEVSGDIGSPYLCEPGLNSRKSKSSREWHSKRAHSVDLKKSSAWVLSRYDLAEDYTSAKETPYSFGDVGLAIATRLGE